MPWSQCIMCTVQNVCALCGARGAQCAMFRLPLARPTAQSWLGERSLGENHTLYHPSNL